MNFSLDDVPGQNGRRTGCGAAPQVRTTQATAYTAHMGVAAGRHVFFFFKAPFSYFIIKLCNYSQEGK